MNLVGAEGKGESVWLAWFLCDVLQGMSEMADILQQPELSRGYRRGQKDSGRADRTARLGRPVVSARNLR